jgi:hypothetical protein
VLAEVTAREIGRVTIAEALELTALVGRKQADRYGRFNARRRSDRNDVALRSGCSVV